MFDSTCLIFSKCQIFIKIGVHFSFGTKFRKFIILDQGRQFQLTYNKHARFTLSAKFHKNQTHCNFETKCAQVFNLILGQDLQFQI